MIYGNPSKTHIESVQNSILLNEWESAGIFQPLLHMPYPCTLTTRGEILSLLNRSVSQDDIHYANDVDEHLYEMWSEYIDSFGYTITVEQIEQWVSLFDPIVDYLKLHYNRPRPFQTAGAFNLPLYPTVRIGSTDSSYPSGHTVHSLIIYHHLSHLYPAQRRDWLQMVCDVAETRLDLGVHYPSDNLFSFQVYHYLRPHITRYLAGYPSL